MKDDTYIAKLMFCRDMTAPNAISDELGVITFDYYSDICEVMAWVDSFSEHMDDLQKEIFESLPELLDGNYFNLNEAWDKTNQKLANSNFWIQATGGLLLALRAGQVHK